MTPEQKAAARDRIAALRVRWTRSPEPWSRSIGDYLAALESLCDELTRPEPEDLVRDLERSIVDAKVKRAAGITRPYRVQKVKW